MADIAWTEAGPRSTRFDDVYFSAEDGLAESRAVYLQGAGLPDAWAGRNAFVVGELGFGTGLNILALLELWSRMRPAGGRLHAFSVEAFPLGKDEAGRALARWPELKLLADRLLDRWPTGPGFHRVDWPELNASLDVAHGEALPSVNAWSGRADAWFLDGFAPARNPEMWSEPLLRAVAARSAPGARAATFTVAGAVRRGLQAAGFMVEKRPGFGRKRERLEAVLPGAPPSRRSPSVAIIGGGVAGAALARAFTASGVRPTVVAAEPPQASGNAAALVSPRFDAGDEPAARLMRQAFERAVDLYTDVPEAVIARGLLQLETRPRDRARFDRLHDSPSARERAARVDAQGAAALVEPGVGPGLFVPGALTVEPGAVVDAWTSGTRQIRAHVAEVRREGQASVLLGEDGREILAADVVVLAGGWSGRELAHGLPLGAVRGQATRAREAALACPVAWGGYAVPTRDGVLFGATHDRGDDDMDAREEDDARNLETLAARLPALARALAGKALDGRAGVRASTPDRLPFAGPLASGLYVLTGLGGRGFATAPLLAEHVAALALETPSPLPDQLARVVDPDRFMRAENVTEIS